MAKELRTLGWDYLMFVLFIAFTVFTPLWKRLFGKKKQHSKADYVFATGGVSLIAVMISISRGTLGVRTVLGYPSELFYRGSGMWEIIYGMATAYPLVCFIFVPVYFNLGITSVYQYLDLRFKSRMVRCLASATYIVRQICSLGVTVYTPSVALSTVIGIPYWASICGMSTICIFFSIKGGLKAAINADVIQTITVIIVSLAIIIKGTIFSGGIKRVYDINRDDGRLNFFNFTGDLTVRVDTTSAWLGQLFVSLSQFGCQQNFMQRYVSLKSLKEVKRAMMSNIPIIFVFFSLSWITGLVIYSSYSVCDPLKEGYINKADEILPFYVEDQLAIIPGFVGIFMATLFNGALCMMVSNLNSLATVISEDFLTLIPKFKNLPDKQQLHIIKTVTVICGIIIMGVAFCVGLLAGVIESSMMAFSATSGPLLGCFILAMLVPMANWKGTSAGMITACATVLWIIAGSSTVDKTEFNKFLPTSTEGCSNFTFSQSIHKPSADEFSFLPTSSSWLMQHTASRSALPDYGQMNTTYLSPSTNNTMIGFGVIETGTGAAAAAKERTPLEYMYSISYMYYSLIGTLLTVLIGIIVSYLTQDPKDSYDAKLLHPLVFRICQRFTGEKPYYVKEIEAIASSAGSNGNINSGSIGNSDSGAKINHAFEAQNETNIIIGVVGNNSNDKEKNPMEVIFTKSRTNATTQAQAQATATTTTTANPLTNINMNANTATTTTTNSNLTIEMPKMQKIFSNNDNNQMVSNDVSGSYRQITEKEMV